MRRILAVLGWLAAAVTATAVGVGAVNIIGTGITRGSGGEIYSQERIARELASAPAPASPAPTTAAPTQTVPQGSRRALSTPGGVVVAECFGGSVTLVSLTPAQGYQVDDLDRGPDTEAEVTFEGAGGEVEVKVRCEAGQPVVTWEADD